MKKIMVVSLLIIAGIAQAEQYPACHREKEILNAADSSGDIREYWNSKLVDCLEKARQQQILQDASDKERAAIEAKERAELAKIEAKERAESAKAEANRAKAEAAWKAEEARRAKLPGVRLGMGTEQVIKMTSWGKPQRIHRTTDAWGTREQWVYGSGYYLYFDNGVLTTIQN